MAIKNIIAKGIGFNPGSVKFIVTHGFGVAVPSTEKFYYHGLINLWPHIRIVTKIRQ